MNSLSMGLRSGLPFTMEVDGGMAEKCRSGASGDGAVGSLEAPCRLARASSCVEAVPFCFTAHPAEGVICCVFKKKR